MAKKNQVYIDIIVDDKGTTKRVAVNAKKLGIELDKSAAATERGAKGTDKLSKSNRNLDRNMRGTAKMSTNQTKEFSKMQQGMGGLVAVYATLAAQVFAVSAAFQFLQSASNIRNLIAGQEALGAVTGTAYKTITSSIIAATDAQINYGDAAKAAAIGTAAGLSSGQLEKLGEVARNASFALGRDLTDSFNRLVRGVTKAEPELLDELGIILRLDTATAKYAESIGVTQSSLTAFQRSQAVANEVLEQGERKFASIEAMMTKDAAALAQFTKSFDDLINIFKTGLINSLGPVLQFLSKNTMALVATMGLFALPIIKAIIPNLEEWGEKQKQVFKDHQHQSAIYMDESMEQSKALEKLTDNETKLASANKKTAEAQKKKTDKGGVGYISGGADSPQARAAAKKGLKLAEEDLRKHTTVKRGIFKGYTAEEVRMARLSYNKRAAMAERHTAFIIRKWKQVSTRAKLMMTEIKIGWAGLMASMSSMTQKAAGVMNKAMTAAGWIGMIVMAAQLAKMGWDWLFPMSDAAKKAEETIDRLSSKYKDLGEEMGRAANARKNFTTGSMDATNIGQVMQSADIPSLVDDLNEMAAMEDKTSDKFKDLKNKLTPVLFELTKINPEFSALSHAMEFGIPIQDELRKSSKKLADGYIEVGSTISNLPELLGKANASFTSLTSSLTKSNPLDAFLTDEAAAIKGLKMDKDEKEAKFALSEQSLIEAEKYEVEQGKIDQRMLDGLKGKYADQMREHWKLADEEERVLMRKKGYHSWGGIAGFRGKIHTDQTEQLDEKEMTRKYDAAEDNVEINKTLRNEAAALLTEREEREDVFLELRNKQLKTTQVRLATEKRSLKNTVLGVTIEGKLNNIQQKRLAGSKAIQKAEDILAIAQTVKDTEKKGIDKLVKKNNTEAIIAAEQQLDLAKEQEKLNERKRRQKEEELRLERVLLGLKIQQFNLANKGKGTQRAIDFQSAMGGGTFASQAEIRRLRGIQLADAKRTAEVNAEVAQTAYDDKLKELRKENTDIAVGKYGIHGTSQLTPERTAQVEQTSIAEARQATSDQQAAANAAVALADQNLELYKKINATKIKEMGHTLELAQLGLELVNVADHLLETEKAIAIAKLTGNAYTKEQIVEMRRLANETEKVTRKKRDFKELKESIYQGFEGAFESLITGAKTAKEAFADMAKGILQAMAQIMARNMAMAAMNFIGMPYSAAKGGITPSYASGGYTSPLRSYGRGGTARGPSAGYNAVLHGNEAVVPLPDNRHIPVDLKGGAGGSNIVTVNVSMGEGGKGSKDTQANSQQAKKMGELVASAVQLELQHQKRSGGILNPYGAA